MKRESFIVPSSDRSSYAVEIVFPDRWNGRFVGLGNGGAGGHCATREAEAWARQGFVAASTDLGTAPDPSLAGWNHPEAIADFGYRATHGMTFAAKERIRSVLGRDPEASYFVGASTGGQQALCLAQRFPADYDGILCGVPAHARTALHAYFLWNYQATHRADGSKLFSKEQEATYRRTVLSFLATRDPLSCAAARGFVSDPRWSAEEREETLSRVRAADPSLTPEHIEALRRLQEGPVHARTGKPIFGGLPPGAEFQSASGNLWAFRWVFGPDIRPLDIDFADDIDRYFELLRGPLDATDENLDAFRARGGKLLLYCGSLDGCCPAHAALDYYERVARRLGSDALTQTFFRLYLLPGRKHMGGPGIQTLPDAFPALRCWVEKGTAPEALDGIGCVPPRFRLSIVPYSANSVGYN